MTNDNKVWNFYTNLQSVAEIRCLDWLFSLPMILILILTVLRVCDGFWVIFRSVDSVDLGRRPSLFLCYLQRVFTDIFSIWLTNSNFNRTHILFEHLIFLCPSPFNKYVRWNWEIWRIDVLRILVSSFDGNMVIIFPWEKKSSVSDLPKKYDLLSRNVIKYISWFLLSSYCIFWYLSLPQKLIRRQSFLCCMEFELVEIEIICHFYTFQTLEGTLTGSAQILPFTRPEERLFFWRGTENNRYSISFFIKLAGQVFQIFLLS